MFRKSAKKVAIGIIGGTVIILGVLMLVLPGPGLLAVGVGLAILATEFVWARLLLRKARHQADGVVGAAKGRWRTWKNGRQKNVQNDQSSDDVPQHFRGPA